MNGRTAPIHLFYYYLLRSYNPVVARQPHHVDSLRNVACVYRFFGIGHRKHLNPVHAPHVHLLHLSVGVQRYHAVFV